MADDVAKSGFDKYDFYARLCPALLVMLPLFLLIAFWFPALWTTLGTAASLLAACGVTFFLVLAVGRMGERVEEKWGELVGRAHSARLLSHADARLSPARKRLVHDFLARHGRGLPDADAERAADAAAQDHRVEAVGWLNEISRKEAASSLLLNANIAYGFWRNMYALKPAALALLAAVLAADAWLMLRWGGADPRFAAGIVLAGFCAAAGLAWLLLVRRQAVAEASLAFAKRLFAQVDNPAVVAAAGAESA